MASECRSTRPAAEAERCVTALPATLTMCALPSARTCVRSLMSLLRQQHLDVELVVRLNHVDVGRYEGERVRLGQFAEVMRALA